MSEVESNGEKAKPVVLVTGAGSGIGRASALRLLRDGYRVVLVGRRAEKLADTAGLAEGASEDDILLSPNDVANEAQVKQMVDEAIDSFGRIDGVVHAAGVNTRDRRLDVLTKEEWRRLVEINLTGTFLLVDALLPVFKKAGGGTFVFISSIAGKRASSLAGGAYSASKFGVNGLAGVLGQEEGENGIRSTVICPGEVNTPILDARPVPVSAERRATMLQPEDVAAAVALVMNLHPRARVPELIITPTNQEYV